MSRINKSQYAILGFLSKRDMSGYDIKQLAKKIASFHWSENNAQIYPILKRLEQEGMVTSQIDAASGARQRRIYKITKQGMQHLQLWLAKPNEPVQYREELLLKLTMGNHIPNDVLYRQVEDYRDLIRQRQKYLDTVLEHVAVDHKGRPDQDYLQITYRHAQLTLAAKLQWAEETLATLQEKISCT